MTARRVGRASVWRDVRDGAHRVAGTPWLRTMLGYSALLQALVIGPHMVAGPLLAAQVYGGPGAWATIGVVQALGSLLGGAVALRCRPRRPLVAAIGAGLLMAPYLAAFAVGAPVWLVAALALAVGAQGALFLTMQTTTVQQHVPEHERSRVVAWTQLGNLVLLPASLAVAGPIAATVGGQAVLLFGAGSLVVSTVLVLCHPAVHRVGTDEPSSAVNGEGRNASAANVR